jgi:hypothetical protein
MRHTKENLRDGVLAPAILRKKKRGLRHQVLTPTSYAVAEGFVMRNARRNKHFYDESDEWDDIASEPSNCLHNQPLVS